MKWLRMGTSGWTNNLSSWPRSDRINGVGTSTRLMRGKGRVVDAEADPEAMA
jgi:hypothetical protein